MVPNKFSTVDLEGIDIVESQGIEIPGLYQKLTDAIMQCRYQVIYNWKFDGIIIPPSYVEMIIDGTEVKINDNISVSNSDVVYVHSLEIHIAPVIDEITITENGEYVAPEGTDGYSPVNVNVPQIPPSILGLNVTENGEYTAPEGTDGYNPVIVNVQGNVKVGIDPPSDDIGFDGDYYYQRMLKSENGYTANPISTSINNKCGYKFTANEDIQVCGIRLFCRSSTTGSLILADANGNILKSITNLVFSSGWNYFYFDEPYSLTQGSSYIVYGSVSNNVLSYQSINSAVFNSKITCLCGLYGTFPGIQDNSDIYGTDIIIIASQNVYEVYKQFIKLSGTWTEI